VNPTVVMPVDAPLAAESMNVWATPGVKVALAGDAVTPAGSPLI
jgi:hypothetical protein